MADAVEAVTHRQRVMIGPDEMRCGHGSLGVMYDRRVPDEPVLVEVEDAGRWWPGVPMEWARWDDRGWLGYVSWSTAPGERFMRWVAAGRVRER